MCLDSFYYFHFLKNIILVLEKLNDNKNIFFVFLFLYGYYFEIILSY